MSIDRKFLEQILDDLEWARFMINYDGDNAGDILNASISAVRERLKDDRHTVKAVLDAYRGEPTPDSIVDRVLAEMTLDDHS